MKLNELKDHDIRRKDNIPRDVRTPGKDEVADHIDSEIIQEGRWPMDVIEIADEVGYSRQHVTNVIKQYYQPAEERSVSPEPEESEQEPERGSVTITVPDDIDDEQSFWRGVAEARRV